jgi:hypothetical protein
MIPPRGVWQARLDFGAIGIEFWKYFLKNIFKLIFFIFLDYFNLIISK